MKFAKLFAHALLAVAFVQTGSAVVHGEYEETGRCEVFLVLLCKNINILHGSASANYFILVRLLHALKCEQAREVGGHASPGKFFTLRSLLRPCLGQKSY